MKVCTIHTGSIALERLIIAGPLDEDVDCVRRIPTLGTKSAFIWFEVGLLNVQPVAPVPRL